MLILLSLILLTHNAQSDADTCIIQANCLRVDSLQIDHTTDTYKICLSWASLSRKDESCVSMLSNWMADGDEQCKTVQGCGEKASFDVPNGEAECVTSDTGNTELAIGNGYASCKGGANTLNACEWTISAPPCTQFHSEESVSNDEGQGFTVLENDGNVSGSMFIISAAIFACAVLSTLCVFIYCKVMECRDEPIVKTDATDVYLDVEQSIDEDQKEDEEVTVVTHTETTT